MKTMKLFKFIILSGCIGACITCIGNENLEEKTNRFPIILNISYSSCDNNIPQDEYIRYYAVNDSTLRFEHKHMVNCSLDSCNVKMEHTPESSIIDVYDYGDAANCICPVTIHYEITNLKKDSTYLFVFKRHSLEMHTCTIRFTTDTSTTINL